MCACVLTQGGTAAAPPQLNSGNREEPDNYWPDASLCRYFVGLQYPDAPPLQGKLPILSVVVLHACLYFCFTCCLILFNNNVQTHNEWLGMLSRSAEMGHTGQPAFRGCHTVHFVSAARFLRAEPLRQEELLCQLCPAQAEVTGVPTGMYIGENQATFQSKSCNI